MRKKGENLLFPTKFLCVLDAKFNVDYDFAIKHDLILWSDQLMGVQSWKNLFFANFGFFLPKRARKRSYTLVQNPPFLDISPFWNLAGFLPGTNLFCNKFQIHSNNFKIKIKFSSPRILRRFWSAFQSHGLRIDESKNWILKMKRNTAFLSEGQTMQRN